MTTIRHGALAVAIVLVAAALAVAAEETQIERGQRVYAEQRCAACHAIAGKGNRRYPLDGVGAKLDASALRTWIVAPTKMKPKVKKPSYDALPAADLDALVAYLESLR